MAGETKCFGKGNMPIDIKPLCNCI